MTIKIAIFDWDGTIVDSIDHIADSLHKAAADLGFPTLEKSAYKNIIGLGMVDALKALYPSVKDPDIESIRQAYSRYFFSKDAAPQQIFPGMTELIAGLGVRGIGRAVATGKSRRGLDAAFQSSGLEKHFDISRCADETRSKPDPKMLEEILDFYQLAPHEAVMIGDTTYDLEMAHRISMPSIGVRWGVHDDKSLSKFSPAALVSSAAELDRVLITL